MNQNPNQSSPLKTIPTLWKPEDVANYLQVSVQSVYRWASQEKIPHLKAGGSLRFDPKDVQDWVAKKPKRRGRPLGGRQN